MNRFTKLNVLLAALALGLWQWPSAVDAAAPGNPAVNFTDSVVATGKGFEIKRSQLDDAFVSYSAGIAANGGSIREDQRDGVRAKLLDHLIITKILTEKATSDDKAGTRKLVDDDIADARKSAPSPEAFEEKVKASGMTLEQVRARAYEEQLARRVLERETTNGITISDDAAKKFYDENPSNFEVPEQVRVSHILISTLEPADPLNQGVPPRPLPPEKKREKEKLAREIKARADKGEDFAKLVKQYSDDPGSKDKGGEYTFPRNQMVPEFEAAAFSLKTNQISDIVETQYGYHIIKGLDRFPAKHESFAESKAKIQAYLVEKDAEKTVPAYLDKLKADAGVKVLDSELSKPLPSATK
ncbi:MAG: peptidylprolyl isomerase [Verrucomicrobiota bacterium]|jgi:peptidyl-prolyl cis-trans isomerase C